MILPLLSGAIFKVYDDIQDSKIDISDETMEIIKVALVCILTTYFMSDIGISSLFILISIACFFVNQVDSTFWRACMMIPFITTLANVHLFQFIGLFDILHRIMFFIITPFLLVGEDNLFPEDVSLTKIIFRIGIVLFCSTIILLFHLLSVSVSPFIQSVMFFVIGYCATSVVLSTHRLYLNSFHDIHAVGRM
jgi:hypothetical protein